MHGSLDFATIFVSL